MNHYGIGLYRMFKTKDGKFEAQGFFCDARGHTTSLCGLAVKMDEQIAIWQRHPKSGPAYGRHVQANRYINEDARQSAFRLFLSSGDETDSGNVKKFEEVLYEETGPLKLEDLGGSDATLKSYHVNFKNENSGELEEKQKPLGPAKIAQNIYAMQFALRDRKARTNAVAPMCVGDIHNEIVVKTFLPRVSIVYEPVVTIEISGGIVNDLADTPGTCTVGMERARQTIDPEYAVLDFEDSLFPLERLFELCGTCGMLDESLGFENQGKNGNRVDKNGWAGCNPKSQPKARTGEETCKKMEEGNAQNNPIPNLVNASTLVCRRFPKKGGSDWNDNCLMEYCNAQEGAVSDPAKMQAILDLIAEAEAEVDQELEHAQEGFHGLEGFMYSGFVNKNDRCNLPDEPIAKENFKQRLIATRAAEEHINYASTGSHAPGLWHGKGNLPRDNFFIIWTGSLRISVEGTYEFELDSDDGSRMWMKTAGEWVKVVDDNGCHAMKKVRGSVNLTPGNYEVQVESAEIGGGWGIIWRWKKPLGSRRSGVQKWDFEGGGHGNFEAVSHLFHDIPVHPKNR
jgi:hypothetical protein